MLCREQRTVNTVSQGVGEDLVEEGKAFPSPKAGYSSSQKIMN